MIKKAKMNVDEYCLKYIIPATFFRHPSWSLGAVVAKAREFARLIAQDVHYRDFFRDAIIDPSDKVKGLKANTKSQPRQVRQLG